MFTHTGFRSLWPVILFLPLLFLGVMALRGALRQRALDRPRRNGGGRR
jgi:hypothetical protein